MKQWAIMLAFAYSLVTLFTVTPVAAEPLDADSVKKVLVDRIWVQKKRAGPGENYWEWKADGSVCLRLFDKTGSCDDAGRWKLEADRICYEMGWWYWKSGCVRISKLTAGWYEAVNDQKVRLFRFTVLD